MNDNARVNTTSRITRITPIQSRNEEEPGEIPENGTSDSTPASATQQTDVHSQEQEENTSRLTEAQGARRQQLESYVRDFRDGRKSRVETFSAILHELGRAPLLTAEEKDTTFQLFSAEVNSAEARTHRQLAITGPIETYTPESNRPQSGPIDDDSGSDDDDDEPKRKKRRLRETDMPWRKRVDLDLPGTNPLCSETVELLRTYNKDIKKCKFYVSVAPGAPDNIPSSQWERIFKGEPVDLDQIISALHRTTVAEDRKARFGETELSLGPVEATRKIATSSDWSTAWRRTARATAFAFQHRKRELEDYAEYIENEFSAKNVGGHQRIILYDVAIRNMVRGGQQFLLTDTHRFMSLYSAIVLPDGVQYSGGQKSQPRKTEICIRFNNKGCSAPNCRYRHACNNCGNSSHGKSACVAPTGN